MGVMCRKCLVWILVGLIWFCVVVEVAGFMMRRTSGRRGRACEPLQRGTGALITHRQRCFLSVMSARRNVRLLGKGKDDSTYVGTASPTKTSKTSKTNNKSSAGHGDSKSPTSSTIKYGKRPVDTEVFYQLLSIENADGTDNAAFQGFEFAARILGEPRPLLRHRVSRGFIYNPSSIFQKSFRDACAKSPHLPTSPLTGPLEAHLFFHFQRPKAHYSIRSRFDPTKLGANDRIVDGKMHTLRADAPSAHQTKKDLDNLVKFVLDAMNGQVYEDDCQITTIIAKKLFSESSIPAIDVAIKKIS
jgi:Holliday junction resolvase RusA-like endonuclease